METRVIVALVAVLLWCSICAQGRRERIQVRLVGGTQPYAGRVMVYHSRSGVWGSVCDNGWTTKNAKIVCKQLGYPGVVLATKGKFFGRQKFYERQRVGSRILTRRTRIWLDRVQCHGDEYNLGYCRHWPWARIRCNRERLAGVMCDPGMKNLVKKPPLHPATQDIDITKFQLSLQPKKNTTQGIITEGVLLVKHENGEGVVCSDGWRLKESRVACGQLGFTHALDTSARISVDDLQATSANISFRLGNVKCSGNEATLLSCNSSGLRHQNCTSGRAVWLRCETKTPTFAHARLHGGVDEWEGRVEVRKRQHWATLCDKDLDIYTANVICRSLGYGTAKEYMLGTVFPHAMEHKRMYESVLCTGKETYLQSCVWTRRKGPLPCRHYSDAGVRCNVPKNEEEPMKIRVAGTTSPLLGRVDIMMNGEWGNICGERWTMRNAMVVCRQLGFGYATNNYSTSHYGRSGKIVMSGVTCLGHESSLDQCLRHHTENVTCPARRGIAAVRCSKVAPDLLWDIKELTKTMSVRYFPIVSLRCAYQENCLAPSAEDMFSSVQLRRGWYGNERRLLRFSAKVHNVGTAAFRPYLPKNAWIWHSCHRHYHSDEEFAFYDLIDPETHQKVAEGHKASYCLEDTKCDAGVEPFYVCRSRGDQGISVNCHDNYDYTLDCQWVDVTDRTVRNMGYKLRLVANPFMKVGESDYSNNVVLCDIIDRMVTLEVGECIQETCVSGVRSHHGNGNFACCRFPFIYDGKPRDTCVLDEISGQFWCGTTPNFDKDKLFGYC